MYCVKRCMRINCEGFFFGWFFKSLAFFCKDENDRLEFIKINIKLLCYLGLVIGFILDDFDILFFFWKVFM